MIKNASEYVNELNQIYRKIVLDKQYMYFFVKPIPDANFEIRGGENLEFVSVNKDTNEVLGFLSGDYKKSTNEITGLRIINFKSKNNLTFSRDLYSFLSGMFLDDGLFLEKGITSMSFQCVLNNPIISMYDRYNSRYNGTSIIAYQSITLNDGLRYNVKHYTVTKVNFDKVYKNRDNREEGKLIELE